jgi:hypothetical protein
VPPRRGKALLCDRLVEAAGEPVVGGDDAGPLRPPGTESQPRTALVGKQRLENVQTESPPGAAPGRPRRAPRPGGPGSRRTRSSGPRRSSRRRTAGRVGVEVLHHPRRRHGFAASSTSLRPSTVSERGGVRRCDTQLLIRSRTSPVTPSSSYRRRRRRRPARRCGAPGAGGVEDRVGDGSARSKKPSGKRSTPRP